MQYVQYKFWSCMVSFYFVFLLHGCMFSEVTFPKLLLRSFLYLKRSQNYFLEAAKLLLNNFWKTLPSENKKALKKVELSSENLSQIMHFQGPIGCAYKYIYNPNIFCKLGIIAHILLVVNFYEKPCSTCHRWLNRVSLTSDK